MEPDDKEISLPQLISELYPSSIKWLERKGYVKFEVIDGYRNIEITPAGMVYFYKIIIQHEPK